MTASTVVHTNCLGALRLPSSPYKDLAEHTPDGRGNFSLGKRMSIAHSPGSVGGRRVVFFVVALRPSLLKVRWGESPLRTGDSAGKTGDLSYRRLGLFKGVVPNDEPEPPLSLLTGLCVGTQRRLGLPAELGLEAVNRAGVPSPLV